jgi:Arc/MetJ-type ribon-helix-helix transcriptional regulator
VHVQLPTVLVERIEEHLKKRGTATSVADFIRQSATDKIERIDREERGITEPVDVAALGDPIKAARRR